MHASTPSRLITKNAKVLQDIVGSELTAVLQLQVLWLPEQH